MTVWALTREATGRREECRVYDVCSGGVVIGCIGISMRTERPSV